MKGEVPPVIVTCKLLVLPAHAVVDPEITAAVDALFTVIMAEPLLPVPTQPPALVTETKE